MSRHDVARGLRASGGQPYSPQKLADSPGQHRPPTSFETRDCHPNFPSSTTTQTKVTNPTSHHASGNLRHQAVHRGLPPQGCVLCSHQAQPQGPADQVQGPLLPLRLHPCPEGLRQGRQAQAEPAPCSQGCRRLQGRQEEGSVNTFINTLRLGLGEKVVGAWNLVEA